MTRSVRITCCLALFLPVTLLAQVPAKPLGPSPARDADVVRPPAPPIPDPPADAAVRSRPGPSPEAVAPDVQSPLPPMGDDPFQQVPLDRAGGLPRASAAFAAKKYAQAASLFAEAEQRNESFTEAQREEWAYCRLHSVAVRLNGTAEPVAGLVGLQREVESALQAGSARLKPFGDQLLAEIRHRGPVAAPSTVEAGWQVVESGSFRVLHMGNAGLAGEVLRTAEAARKDMYERWAGPAAAPWSPRCDIYLHRNGADYTRASGKSADCAGHSTVGTKAGRVVSRQIDLRADEPSLLDGPLPSEVTQVILAELFADEPLPRWAIVGMAALAESPERVARYHRSVPALLREKKLFSVGPFLEQSSFPAPASVTPFYAESVSLVSYLVELRGPKAFTAFLREAPRRGYARALATHYGFKDAADLQDRWVKHSLGAQ